ncbi:MAG: urease subunit beta [Lachnospiraceae bacterium]
MIPGEVIARNKEIILNKDRRIKELEVSNIGDRPIQVGSHFHFFETNKLLSFDRSAAFGMRLDIPSGTSVRFEPGEIKTVQLVEVGGKRRIFGLNNLTQNTADQGTLGASMDKASEKGFVRKEDKIE